MFSHSSGTDDTPAESLRPLHFNRPQANTGVWLTLPIGVVLTMVSGR